MLPDVLPPGEGGGCFCKVNQNEDWIWNWDFHNTTVDWFNRDMPVTVIFGNNAEIRKVKDALNPYGYSYGPPYADPQYEQLNDGNGGVWDEDSGRKNGLCTDTHYRAYADGDDRMYNTYYGFYIAVTTHRDVNECPGGPPKTFGWSEEAEFALIQTVATIWPGHAYHDTLIYNNQVVPYWIGDHYYQSNGLASWVSVP
jgi:hypothetical protein